MHSKLFIMQKTKILVAILVLIGFSSCNDYGKKVTKGHVETYYKDGITEDQAKRVAEVMYNIDEVANNPKIEKSYQVCKKNDTVCFRMVVADKETAKALGDDPFIAIGNIISDSVFNGAPVNVDLTNDHFESIKFIPYKKADTKVVQGHIETFYKDGITEDQAKKTADLMYNIDEAANNDKVQKSFQLSKKNDSVCLSMVVNEEKAKTVADISFIVIANMVSDSVFNGAPVNMSLTNDKFESLKYLPYKKVDLNNLENNN